MRRPTRRMPPTGGRTHVMQLELEQFANRLHALRTAKGWSQSDLAREIWGEIELASGKRAAKNRDRISSYEMGKGWPDPHNLKALAKALDVSPEELAPDIVGATVEHQFPEIALTSVAGHLDKVMLRVNKLVSFETATRVMALLSEPSTHVLVAKVAPKDNDLANGR